MFGVNLFRVFSLRIFRGLSGTVLTVCSAETNSFRNAATYQRWCAIIHRRFRSYFPNQSSNLRAEKLLIRAPLVYLFSCRKIIKNYSPIYYCILVHIILPDKPSIQFIRLRLNETNSLKPMAFGSLSLWLPTVIFQQ